MPRLVGYTTRSTAKQRERDKKIRARGSNRWIDPFPGIHGTVPEKMVYAELSRRNIPFLFLNDIRFQFPELDFDKEYQADFVIPSLRLIIEVQGARWHSMPGTIESDALKFAIYETAGYRVLAWWDFDIISNLFGLFASDAQLTAVSNPSTTYINRELPVQRRTKVDTSKGIRTMNRRRGTRLEYRKKPVTLITRKSTKSFGSFTSR